METACPICRKPVVTPESSSQTFPSYFPFCSERCKLIDLGRWLDGRYQIPVSDDDQDDQAVRLPGADDDE